MSNVQLVAFLTFSLVWLRQILILRTITLIDHPKITYEIDQVIRIDLIIENLNLKHP